MPKHPRYEANEHVHWKNIVLKNLVGGIMWGLGSVFGATIIVSLLIWALGKIDFVPYIAEYIERIRNILEARY